jgi:hypothetical protein
MEADLIADRGWKPTTSMTRDGRAVLVLDFQEVRITRERETGEITDKSMRSAPLFATGRTEYFLFYRLQIRALISATSILTRKKGF